ncbi:MAG: YqgE/AlgH family protein [Clostridium sp.]|nr:YqgE/AlgH family protein [Prevotella sp.]MCM1428687.1 YqgE/AlgH family protein [Clostridium sp.]MCM1475062.1 YqgE/AlgH family protein [Muribaculaceae bacterium]
MNLNNFIHNDSSLDIILRPGCLLLASPLMKEPHFDRGVIALIDTNNERGCLGLTLNKPTTMRMENIFDGWQRLEGIPIYLGGPVDTQRLFMLHRLGDVIRGSMEIDKGLYIGNNIGDAFRYLELGGKLEGELRFFLGYSGWVAGQLEQEIKNQAWAVNDSPHTDNLLIGEGEEYWRREIRDLGEDFRPWLMMPEHPWEN